MFHDQEFILDTNPAFLDISLCQSLQLYHCRDELCNSVDRVLLLCSFLVQFKVFHFKVSLQTRIIYKLNSFSCYPVIIVSPRQAEEESARTSNVQGEQSPWGCSAWCCEVASQGLEG